MIKKLYFLAIIIGLTSITYLEINNIKYISNAYGKELQTQTLDCVVIENDVSSNILASFNKNAYMFQNDILVLKCAKVVFPIFKKNDKVLINKKIKIKKIKDFRRIQIKEVLK